MAAKTKFAFFKEPFLFSTESRAPALQEMDVPEAEEIATATSDHAGAGTGDAPPRVTSEEVAPVGEPSAPAVPPAACANDPAPAPSLGEGSGEVRLKHAHTHWTA